MPVVRIRDNTSFNENEFIVKSYDNILYRETVESIEENTFQYIIQKASDVCRNNYASILNKQTVKIIIDSIKDYYPGVADGLVPEKNQLSRRKGTDAENHTGKWKLSRRHSYFRRYGKRINQSLNIVQNLSSRKC